MSELTDWHKTVFAEFQRAHPDDRSAWHAWCGELRGMVLDLGCGGSAMEGAIGIDLAFGDIQADCLRLPLLSQCVDVIASTHLIEHVDPMALISECKRVLKPNGLLFVEGPNLCGLARAGRVWEAGCRTSHYPLGASRKWIALLKGFLAYRYIFSLTRRVPCLDVSFPGKDPDAVWQCNYFTVARLLRSRGFEVIKAEGRFNHSFRLLARGRLK